MALIAPYLPYDKLRAVAEEFLAKYHPSGDIPVPIERIVEFRFKLDIVPVPGLQDECDADAFITSDLSEIRVDQFIYKNRPARYRFSLAHELAHVLVHQDVFKELKFTTVAEWKAAISSIPEDQRNWIEWQGYCLGGLILVPPQPLKDLFATKCAEAKRAGVELRGAEDRLRKIVHSNMAKFFDVSSDVIVRRMNYDKLWTQS
ncbi:MAG TPA: ImmA/IrrE family metallo-endopeptidase [Gemmataceae bacterium]|nr:ImmA/IrrE family metallo-endopeptidase [Gemmataceae bacterium]